MQGVTKMNEDRAANKTREDKRKTMGIQMSIDDMAADRSFTNQKALLSVKAGMDLKGNIISQFNSSKEVGMDALTSSPLSTLQLPELDMKATKYAWKSVLQTYGLEGLKSAGLYESNKTTLDILQKEIDEENDERNTCIGGLYHANKGGISCRRRTCSCCKRHKNSKLSS
jgi:hypothetical protein